MKKASMFSIDDADLGPTRRDLLVRAAALAGATTLAAGTPARAKDGPEADPPAGPFWPEGIRLVVSISMQFEAGGQPSKGTDSPFPRVDFSAGVPSDAAANTWFAYGYREGIPRMLDLWDRHGVKVTCHMIGEAARRHPELAREIVSRGHEPSGHGPRWSSQYAMSRNDEKQFLIEARDMVEAATGRRPMGYNCNWLRRGPNTLSLLQELGYLYHIDDVSRGAVHRASQWQGLRRRSLHPPQQRHRADRGPQLLAREVLRADQAGLRSALRGGRAPAPHDVGQCTRPHQRYATNGARLGRVPPLRKEPARSGVPAQGRDREVRPAKPAHAARDRNDLNRRERASTARTSLADRRPRHGEHW